MSRRTYTWNAYESQLAGPLLSGSTSVAIDSAIGLAAPAYLVIDPDIPLKREWIRVNTINANNLENMIRNQDGSVGNIDHESGAKVRAVFTNMVQDDIFEDIEDAELWITGHVNVTQQPHPHTQYLRESDANGLYVQLTGAVPMTGPLTLWGDPTQALHAATKQYVDGSQTFLHDDLTDVVSDQHHTRYADSEAVAAQGSLWLPIGGAAVSAGKWTTGRTLTIALSGDASGSNAQSVDGSTNETWTIPVVVKDDSHLHDLYYLRKANGTVTGLTVGSAGIAYTGTGGGGTANQIGFRWGGIGPNKVTVTIDNNVSYALADHADFASYLPLAGGLMSGAIILPQSTNTNTMLRIAGMPANSGLYGSPLEMSIDFNGWRTFSVFGAAGSSHIVEARSNDRNTRPFLMYNAAATAASDIAFTAQWGSNQVEVSYADLSALRVLAEKKDDLLALV